MFTTEAQRAQRTNLDEVFRLCVLGVSVVNLKVKVR